MGRTRRNSLRAAENLKSRKNFRNCGNSRKESSKADRRFAFPNGSVSAQARRRVNQILMVKRRICSHLHQSQKRKKRKRKKRRRKRKSRLSYDSYTVPDVFLFDCTGRYTVYCDELRYDCHLPSTYCLSLMV